MDFYRFLKVVIICLVLLLVIIQAEITGYINSTEPSKDNVTIAKNSTVVSTTAVYNVTNKSTTSKKTGKDVCNETEIPFVGYITLWMSIPHEKFTVNLNFSFNGTVGNPKGDKINFKMGSPKHNETLNFKIQLLILDESGEPLIPKITSGITKNIRRKDSDDEDFIEQKTYETNSTDDAFSIGIICMKLL
ncbi:hypothetical protein TNIN_352071 [Trichonephila inaurata madagascariensis]|uniref:Uncharacterized protein n=1 Tax=Trichonephila inaurata madagascariensis TaxID=2747483 RepID=A0A8X7C7Z5_9ARAC|nr:hypothetical protein TNIN_352071 [Trichonephila inaurata madagascariensis]